MVSKPDWSKSTGRVLKYVGEIRRSSPKYPDGSRFQGKTVFWLNIPIFPEFQSNFLKERFLALLHCSKASTNIALYKHLIWLPLKESTPILLAFRTISHKVKCIYTFAFKFKSKLYDVNNHLDENMQLFINGTATDWLGF